MRRNLRGRLFLNSRRLWCLRPLRSDCLGIADPDQNSAILVRPDTLGINQFFLEHIEVLVIQIEAHLQCSIGHPSLAFEEGDDLFEDVVKRHDRHSSNASNNALASFKSAVSNPSVNQWYTGARRSRASWRFPCCCHRRLKLITARSSSDLPCWFWAIAMACWKQDSASVWLLEDCCNRSSPLSRYSPGSDQRSPVVSASLNASVSTVSPASGSPRVP